MAYLEITDFKAGLDTRRLEETSQPGTLARLDNGHLTRGAEVEKSLAWVELFELPENTFGLAVESGDIKVFGSLPYTDFPYVPAWGGPFPSGVKYHQLSPATGGSIVAVNSYDAFDGKIYVSATFDTGNTYHFYETSDDPAVPLSVVDVDPEDLELTPGGFVRTLKSKMFSVNGSIVQFSAINAPTIYKDDENNVGSGFINLGNQAGGSPALNCIAKYGKNVAIFGRRSVQIWFLDTDPAQDQQLQVLSNTGAVSARSVVEFGDIDVFYLSTSGIRSIKARDSSNAAFSSDIGTAIDEGIVSLIRENPELAAKAVAELEPFDGRYMLAIGSTIYVFSYFPSSKISAWSTYQAPGDVSDLAVSEERTFMRSGNKIYQLGGEDFLAYDDTPLIIETPFLDVRTPATAKDFTSIDIAARGTFDVEVASDPTEPDLFRPVAEGVTNSTFKQLTIPLTVSATHIKLRITSRNDGYARIGKIIIHFKGTDEE